MAAAALPPVLFVHGMFQTGPSWAGWERRFQARGFVTSAPNWPGREGDTAGVCSCACRQSTASGARACSALRATPPERLSTLTLTQVVEAMEAEATRLGGRPILVGHSMGGWVPPLLPLIQPPQPVLACSLLHHPPVPCILFVPAQAAHLTIHSC